MTQRTCTFQGCDRPHNALGLCGPHYAQRARGVALYALPPIRRNGRPAEDRFFEKVTQDGDCWRWTGALSHGYGKFWTGDRHTSAHRWAFEFLRGAIPAGLHLDHLCRNTWCVNPWHVEPVTTQVNTARIPPESYVRTRLTECQRGHAMTADNIYTTKAGKRKCRACQRLRALRYRRRTKHRLPAGASAPC